MGDGNIHYDVLRADGGSDAEHSAARDEGSRIVHDIVAAWAARSAPSTAWAR
jgi:hypothetical protein